MRRGPRGPLRAPIVWAAWLAVAAGCRAPDARADAPARVSGPEGSAASLVVQRVRASIAPPVDAGDRTIVVVRADPARYALRLLMASRDGPARPLPRWVRDYRLAAGINASMFRDDQRTSTGLMRDRGHVNSDQDNPLFGGFLTWSPTRRGDSLVRLQGRDCPGFALARIRAAYATIVQSYRLLDCAGRPIAWQDPKIYSAAAIQLAEQVVLGGLVGARSS